MKDWVNLQVFENKFDGRCKVLVYPQVNIFDVPDNAPKEFRRFAYAVRGLVEVVEVTESGEVIINKTAWQDKMRELDREDAPPVENTPAGQGQGDVIENEVGDIIGVVENTNADGMVNVRLNSGSMVFGSEDMGNWMNQGPFAPHLELNLYETVVKFLRENGLYTEYRDFNGNDHNEIIPADLEVLIIEYDLSRQMVMFTVWSQYFAALPIGAEAMHHELVFADLKEQKPKVSEDGRQLRKLMVEETHELPE